MTEKPSADFEPIQTLAEMTQSLMEAGKTAAEATISTKENKQVFKTHIAHYSKNENRFYAWVPPEVEPEAFVLELKEDGDTSCLFSVSLKRSHIFFKAECRGYDQHGLKFDPPKLMYKVQRRQHMRFEIPDGHILKIKYRDPNFPDRFFDRKAVDISAGGIALLIREEEDPLFHEGQVVEDVQFTIHGQQIQTHCEVRYKKPMPQGYRHQGIKVGLKFINLSQKDFQYISRHVFEETRKYLSRFL